MTADDLMGLFTYLIINTTDPKIVVDFKIVEKFITRSTEQSSLGFYFANV